VTETLSRVPLYLCAQYHLWYLWGDTCTRDTWALANDRHTSKNGVEQSSINCRYYHRDIWFLSTSFYEYRYI
jgi:hypothetical protein